MTQYLELASESTLLNALSRRTDVLVFRHLAELMNPYDGVTGRTHAISHRILAEELSDKHKRGRNRQVVEFTAKSVRGAIERLCACGLLERLSKKHSDSVMVSRVFWVKCLTSPHCVQNELGNLLGNLLNIFKLGKPFNNKNLKDENNNKGNPLGNELGIYNILPSYLPAEAENNQNQAFRMHLDWQPSSEFKKAIIGKRTLTAELGTALDDAVLDFKLYWRMQSLALDQANWEKKLYSNDLRAVLAGRGKPLPVGANVTPITQGKSKPKPPRLLKVPYGVWGAELQDWAVKHGFRTAKDGEVDQVYKQALQVHVERLNQQRDSRQAVAEAKPS